MIMMHTHRCIGKNSHTPVVLLSLKSLGYLLHWNLPSMQRCAPLVGRHVLARLVRSGVGIRGEMGQACFKALSKLFKSQVHVFGVSTSEEAETGGGAGTGTGTGTAQSGAGTGTGGGGGGKGKGKRKGRRGGLFGLSPKQLRALLVVLQMAVVETEHQNATFTLIKAVVSRQVMLPEVRFCLIISSSLGFRKAKQPPRSIIKHCIAVVAVPMPFVFVTKSKF